MTTVFYFYNLHLDGILVTSPTPESANTLRGESPPPCYSGADSRIRDERGILFRMSTLLESCRLFREGRLFRGGVGSLEGGGSSEGGRLFRRGGLFKMPRDSL